MVDAARSFLKSSNALQLFSQKSLGLYEHFRPTLSRTDLTLRS